MAQDIVTRALRRARRVPHRYWWIAVLVLIWTSILLTSCDRGREDTEVGTPQPQGRPNVILILADDLDKSVFSRTPLDSAWVTEGASFSNALATTSLCCPSRASILKGQYAHNTGLVNNENFEPGGGAQYFGEEGLDQRTLATLLKGEGYETWFGGKYLNGYESAGGAAVMSRPDGTAGKPTFIPTRP